MIRYRLTYTAAREKLETPQDVREYADLLRSLSGEEG